MKTVFTNITSEFRNSMKCVNSLIEVHLQK